MSVTPATNQMRTPVGPSWLRQLADHRTQRLGICAAFDTQPATATEIDLDPARTRRLTNNRWAVLRRLYANLMHGYRQ
jgi:hypothetical protein